MKPSMKESRDDEDWMKPVNEFPWLGSILPRDAMLARYMLSSCVRLSIRHSPILYRKG